MAFLDLFRRAPVDAAVPPEARISEILATLDKIAGQRADEQRNVAQFFSKRESMLLEDVTDDKIVALDIQRDKSEIRLERLTALEYQLEAELRAAQDELDERSRREHFDRRHAAGLEYAAAFGDAVEKLVAFRQAHGAGFSGAPHVVDADAHRNFSATLEGDRLFELARRAQTDARNG